MKKGDNGKNYLLLDAHSTPVAKVSVSDTETDQWTVKVLEWKRKLMMDNVIVQLVPLDSEDIGILARAHSCRGDRIEIEKIREEDGKHMRQNLRMPISFKSHMYPVSGSWVGRRDIIGKDLSSGGVAFYCKEPLYKGEIVEVVIPVTGAPLILRLEVLRGHFMEEDAIYFFAGRFVDICNDEESQVRETVFSIQLERRALDREK